MALIFCESRTKQNPFRAAPGAWPVDHCDQFCVCIPAAHPEHHRMLTDDQALAALKDLLLARSIFRGNFTLASGAKSNYYVDCRLTTFDAQGAWLIGQSVRAVIRREAAARSLRIDSVGGLTMGADPIALATGMFSQFAGDNPPFRVFAVRKAAKGHGQGKLIEANFKKGDSVVIIEDTITSGASALNAIEAVQKEGGKIAFVVALVDREEGGRKNIEALGHSVFSLFTRSALLPDLAPAA